MGMSQICTGADHYFRPSKPHSGKLWYVLMSGLSVSVSIFNVVVRGVRVSKFRHVYGVPAKKEKCYEGARITRRCYFALLITLALLITE